MAYKAKDNAYSTLASGISSGATALSVQTGHGDRFPIIAGADYTKLTIENAAGDREVVHVTARSSGSDSMTITRAQDGTTALAWLAGDVVECRPTASLAESFDAKMDAAAVHAATSKATPVDADELPLIDSAAAFGLKRLTWANLKATLWAALGVGINAQTAKTTPVDADMFAIADSAASNATKKLTWANLKATVRTYLLGTASTYTAVQTITRTTASSASYTWATDTNPNVEVTTTGNLTMNAPTGMVAGGFYFLEVIYGGAHTITWNANFKGVTGLVVSSTNGQNDAFMFRAISTTVVELVGVRLNVGA